MVLYERLEMGLDLAIAASAYWVKGGRLTEGRFWIEKYLEICRQREVVSSDRLRDAVNCAGILAFFRDDLPTLRQHAEWLLTFGKERQNKTSMMSAYFLLGQDALVQQDYERAKPLFEESLALARHMGELGHTASTLNMLGLAAKGQNNYTRALDYNAESLALCRQLGDRWQEALLLSNNASVWEEQGNYQEAGALYQQGLTICLEIDDKRSAVELLEQLSGLLDLRGKHPCAARLMGTAEALRQSISLPVDPYSRPYHERRLVRLHANLDEITLTAEWTEGRLMTLEQAVEYALISYVTVADNRDAGDQNNPILNKS